MATKKSVLWSKEMYSPLDIKKQFTDRFPVIVMVARGYYGQTEIDTVGSDQVLIIQGWSWQKRVVARDTKGRIVSIPADYPLKFEVTSKTDQDLYLRPVSSRARPLWQVIDTFGLPISVQFDRQVSSCFYAGGNPRCTETFGQLELIAVYDENYLKANTINAGKIDTDAITVVPMYMKTHFVIAEGLKGTPANLWENMRQHYIARVQHLDFDHVNGNMDIMIYGNQVTTTRGKDYDLIMPKSYVRHASIGNISGRFTSDGTIKTVVKTEPRYYPLKSRSKGSTDTEDQGHSQQHHSQQHHSQQHHSQQHLSPQQRSPRHHPAAPTHVIIQGEGLYTGLIHTHPPRRSSGESPHRPSSPPSRPAPVAPPKGGLTSENQGELVQALRKLSASRRERLSDSSTDSSTTSSNSTTSNSEHSTTSDAKLSSSHVQNSGGQERRTSVGNKTGSCLRGSNSIHQRDHHVHFANTRTRIYSESDSGKGSQYTAEELVSSDDSDDVFYNNDDPAAVIATANQKGWPRAPCLQPLRRNRSESDAPRDLHFVYPCRTPEVDKRGGTSSCSAVDNNAYFCSAVGGWNSHRPPQALLSNSTFKSLEDIPEDITNLTVEEVADCLRLLNLGMFVRKFADYQVDGALLKTFTHEEINKEFGISSVIAKKLEQFAKHGWRPRLNLSPPCGSPVKHKQ